MRRHQCVSSDDTPRSMRDPLVRLRRCEMLLAPHMKPLTEYAGKLRKLENCEVPNFDPFDGGTKALALFLFEKPGPMTADSNSGSGFISRNNDDPTAEATFNFMQTAGIPRELTVLWNVIPWWNGTRKVTSAELHAGVECLEQLIGLLPMLHVVVFVGQKAAKARPVLGTRDLQIFSSDHPSPLVRAKLPKRWRAIPSDWAKIKPFLGLP